MSFSVAPDSLPIRRIVVSARPPEPEPSMIPGDMSWSTQQNPPRPSYPKELLKHRFLPVGAETPASQENEERMEVDAPAHKSSPSKHKADNHEGEPKAKKRKSEGSMKKFKKAKDTE